MRVGIVGAGRVGSTLARLFAAAGHEVVLAGSRDRAKLEQRAQEAGARPGSNEEAAAFGEVLVLAVPWEGALHTVRPLGEQLAGKVLVDATNNLRDEPGGNDAQKLATAAPGARVVKAFNTVFVANYDDADPGNPPDMLFCGDDADAKRLVSELIVASRHRPVDCGGLDMAREVEAFARLVITMAYQGGAGPFSYRLEIS